MKATSFKFFNLIFSFILVASSTEAQTIDGGSYHSLAICSDSTVKAWGYNDRGQLGDGTYTQRTSPVSVTGLTGIRAVASSGRFSMALKSDGTVWCWGNNDYGQLGKGDTALSTVPVQTLGLTGVTAISAADRFALALKSDGTVWGWGWNALGELGDGTTTDRLTPVQVSGLTNVIAISASTNHSVALLAGGTVMIWGWNASGQLGDGTTTQQKTPIQVPGLTGITAITTGAEFTLALKADGTVWSWGRNDYGQLGLGFNGAPVKTPTMISNLSGVINIASGASHSLAMKAGGILWSWGYNYIGQLGDGTSTDRYSPVQVIGLAGVTVIGAGGAHSLALQGDSLRAWGHNQNGQLGIGNYTSKNLPVTTLGLCPVLGAAPLKANYITGVCYIDYNTNNTKDSGEPGLPNMLLTSVNDLYSLSTFTYADGAFRSFGDLGSVTTSPRPINYFTFSPSQHVSNFSSYYNTDTTNFAYVPVNNNIQDLRIEIIPTNSARIGRNHGYRLVYENIGTKVMSGSVSYYINSGMTYVSANPAYTSMVGNVIKWDYTNLVPTEKRSVDVTLFVPITLSIGSFLLPFAQVDPISTDSIPSDNTAVLEDLIVGAYDPNDKTMLGGDDITIQQVAAGEYLRYVVRFQNTGNDTCFKIVILDTLDTKLDWNTFEMVSSSHETRAEIRDGKNIAFIIDNALLPDSNIDEPGSHGYICYRIKAKSNVQAGNVIRNTAYIYFDFNAPVATNTALTVISDFTGVAKDSKKNFTIYPNPASDKLTVVTGEDVSVAKLEIVNMLGAVMLQAHLENSTTVLDVSSLSSGIYFVRITDNERSVSRKMVVE